MQITEIFHSIQGESTYGGWPCTFVRLTACNLRCTWCDSEYTFTGGIQMSLGEVMERVRSYSAPLVEITGGEPMLQEEEVLELSRRLLADGYTVLLETSGERNLTRVPKEVIKVMDVKCPGSGEGGRFCVDNLAVLSPRDEVKFVLAGREDYDFAVRFLNEHPIPGAVHFSPVFGKLDPKELAAWVLEDGINVRINLQVHKLLELK